MAEQFWTGNPFINCLCRHRLLSQGVTLITDLFATHILFLIELCQPEIQFLTDIFADTTELTSTTALRSCRFMLNTEGWQIRQRSTFRFVDCGFLCSCIGFICIQPFQLKIDCCDIFFNRFVPQMDLLCSQMFVFTAEFVFFKQSKFMLVFLSEKDVELWHPIAGLIFLILDLLLIEPTALTT